MGGGARWPLAMHFDMVLQFIKVFIAFRTLSSLFIDCYIYGILNTGSQMTRNFDILTKQRQTQCKLRRCTELICGTLAPTTATC